MLHQITSAFFTFGIKYPIVMMFMNGEKQDCIQSGIWPSITTLPHPEVGLHHIFTLNENNNF
jgi:hypothetical protein